MPLTNKFIVLENEICDLASSEKESDLKITNAPFFLS
jgi:hypothetical protein